MTENNNRALVIAGKMELGLQHEPNEVLEAASKAAKALQKVLGDKPKKVIINGEQYLEFEDWQTLGQFYGYTVKTLDAEPVEINGIRGAKARAELIDFRTGEVVGGADSYCMNDEERWEGRPWFQLSSMAQTRAAAKALRNRLAWVAVLAGYRPTPAEEMTGDEAPRDKEPEHFCSIHKTAFRKFTKDGNSWYSHKLPDGKYCNEAKVAAPTNKPPEPAPAEHEEIFPTVDYKETASEQVANAVLPSQEDHQTALIKAGLLADITDLMPQKGVTEAQMNAISKRDAHKDKWQDAGIDSLSVWKETLEKQPDFVKGGAA